MITSTHLFYIPIILIAGFLIGFFVGRRLLLAQLERAESELDE